MIAPRWVVVCPDGAVRTSVEAALSRLAAAVVDRTGERAMLIEADPHVVASLARAFPAVLISPEKAGYQA